jgi:dienelactone hydrolase
VVVHGNSSAATSYLGYNYLLDHLARNGMIAASIHVYVNAKGESRARALFKHLALLQAKFPGKIDMSKIGIMGHSRGGEAVVIASKINVDEALGYNFKAIVALAPTDQYGPFSLTGAYHQPFLVIYGGLDGDLTDGPAFRLYDRASPLRAMIFAEHACHDRFNTEWNDNDFYFGAPWGLPAADQAKVSSLDAHQRIAKGYMNAFFRWHLFGQSELAAFFTGELTPIQVEQADGGTVKLHAQYEAPAPAGAPAALIVDRFANGNWQSNDLGAVAAHNGTLPVNPGEGMLKTLDTFSPHDTAGALIRWSATTGIYLTNVPVASGDVSVYDTLSFRVGQRYGSASNPANAEQDLYLRLTDTGGSTRALLVSKFASIPFPMVRGYNQLTKSALKTVRIPLADYRIEVLGTQKVDLTKVATMTFEFSARATGEIEVDDIEFGY